MAAPRINATPQLMIMSDFQPDGLRTATIVPQIGGGKTLRERGGRSAGRWRATGFANYPDWQTCNAGLILPTHVEVDARLQLKAERKHFLSRRLFAFFLLAPMLGGCSGLTDFSVKDQEWFQRPSKIFGNRSLALETPPLSLEKAVTAEDLISAEGACPGMAPTAPADANALQDSGQSAAAISAPVALGHTECDVARAIGTPSSVNLSNNQRGERVATITYLQGSRSGIYTFTAGRLTAIERVDQPAPAPKPAKKRRAA